MTGRRHEGATSAVPTFDPAQWTVNWTAIGGGYARTTGGLFLSWDEVIDSEERARLRQQLAPAAATRTLIDYLDARQTGQVRS